MQVQVNFLPVGHTHEDVDQMFSKIGDEITQGKSAKGNSCIFHQDVKAL